MDAEDDGAYIPKILAEEMAEIQAEIMGDYGSLTIDGTRRNGEALAGDFRSRKDFDFEHFLVQFKTTAKNVQGIDLAAIITNLRTLTLHKSIESLTCISSDGCRICKLNCYVSNLGWPHLHWPFACLEWR